MPIVRFICLLALLAGVLLYGLERVHAEVSPDVREACTPDAMRAVISVAALPMSICPQAMSYLRQSSDMLLVSPVMACLVAV